MSEWKAILIQDVSELNDKSITSDYPYSVIQYLDTGSITEGRIESYQELNFKEAPSRARRLVKENDIVYSTVRPIQRHFGFIKSPPPNLVVSTGFCTISVNPEKANAKFLYYYLTNNEIIEYLDIIAEASVSTYPSIKPSDIGSMSLMLPSLKEQKAIAEVLGSIDDKIELLNQQNKTLEKMAETLFRKWFVEEAKDDWRIGTLGDILSLVYGIPLKKEDRSGQGYPVLGSSGVVGYHSEYYVEGPGIVIGRKGTIGRVNYVFNNFTPIDTTYYIKSKDDYNGLFYHYFLLKAANFESSDSAVPGLNRNIALATEIPLVPKPKIIEFNTFCSPIFTKLDQNNSQIIKLTKCRDSMLPKLMNDEIRIDS